MNRIHIALPHGQTLSALSAGQAGQPVALCLHGFPEGAFVWETLLQRLADAGFYAVAPDLRGFGASDAPPDPSAYRPKHLVQDIAALIDHLAGPGLPLAALIAHDWGGAIAWNVANRHPSRLQKLVILNAPHPGLFWQALRTDPGQQSASQYMNFLSRPDAESLLAADGFRRLWRFFNHGGAIDASPEWLTDALRAHYEAHWKLGLRGGCNLYRASPLRPATASDPGANGIQMPDSLWRIDVNTLVLWGEQDAALRPVLIEGLDTHIPRLQLQRWPDASHWLLHEHPDRVAQAVLDFVCSA